jgi:hypothetical protein
VQLWLVLCISLHTAMCSIGYLCAIDRSNAFHVEVWAAARSCSSALQCCSSTPQS